jgi:hypothetical protein
LIYGAKHIALGLVPNGERPVTPVPARYLRLVPKPANKTVMIKTSGADPERDTVPLMKKKIRKCVHQVEKLAKELKSSSVYETVKKDWNFIFDHIQYVQDPDDVESVRDPARTIHDAKGDCDCFTVLLGCLLSAQNIPFKIRVAAYDNPKEWSHVYIIVPVDKSKYITVDPVLHKYDQEAKFTNKKDFDMKLASLEGFGDCSTAASGPSQSSQLIRYIDTESVVQWGYVPTQQFLEENKIQYEQQVLDDKHTEFVVKSPGGEIKIPTIISPDQADKIKTLMSATGDKAEDLCQKLRRNFKWWWVLVGMAVIMLLFGGDGKEERQSKSLDGFTKKKKRQAKLATVNM